MDKKKKLIDTVLELFFEYGPSFKVEDVAKKMKMSKKTIYKEYGNKEDLLILVVHSIFESIEKQVSTIIESTEFSTIDKLIKLTCAFPDAKDVDYHKAILLKKDFKKPYEIFIDYIEHNWSKSKQLFDKCIEEGFIKPIDYEIFRLITLGITKQVLDSDTDDKEALLLQCVNQFFQGIIA